MIFSWYSGTYIIIPPNKINKKYYRCDNKFYLDDVKNLHNEETNYGICLISGKEYRCYIVEKRSDDKQFKLVSHDKEKIMNQHKTGGQSAQRFSRLRDIQIGHYVSKISEEMVKSYLSNNHTVYKIEKLVIAGNSNLKYDVLENELIKKYFSKRIIKIINTTEIDDNTIHEVYEQCYELFESKENIKNKQIMKIVKDLIENDINKLLFGEDDVIEGLINKSIYQIIISDDIDKTNINKANNGYCEIITIPKNIAKTVGSIVAIKWYSYEN